jgi:flavin-dependent dehydrogenase
MTHEVDVAILGGGLAGNLLARQLRRTLPDLSVAVFERDRERGYKVGESTVEIAAHYLICRQGLSTYLYQEMLPKNGLRFFFDSKERDLDITEMSEIGINGLPPYPSFQLDRARLERDLMGMNEKMGVDVRIGASVKDLVLGTNGERHRFAIEHDGTRTEWSARWVADASGRESIVAKQQGLRLPEKSHRIAASWGRFEDVGDMDGLDAPEWRARARNTARYLSTNHFSYPGYWIWFIPLKNDVVSVGVVMDSKGWNTAWHKLDGLMKFLREHRAPASLLEDAKAIDVAAFTQLAFRTKQYFSADRWGLVGDASAFTDPFYSPGSDFIATANDFMTDLIARDVRGESLEEPVQLFDAFMQFRLDTTMVVYDQLYQTFGSYELFRAKAFFDTGIYYNLLFDSYVRNEHLDVRWLRTMLRRRKAALDMMTSVGKSFATAAQEMHRRGTYYRKNSGHYTLDGRHAYGVLTEVGKERSRREINARTEEVLAHTEELLSVALDHDYGPVPRLVRPGDLFADALLEASGRSP